MFVTVALETISKHKQDGDNITNQSLLLVFYLSVPVSTQKCAPVCNNEWSEKQTSLKLFPKANLKL